jgi:hypothetical protein
MNVPRVGRPAGPVLAAGVTMAVILVTLSWYYFARYRTNSEYLVRRDFRVLGIAGRQLQATVDDVARMMDAHAQEVARWQPSAADPDAPQVGRPPLAWASEKDAVEDVFKRSRQGLFGLKPPYVEFESCLFRAGATSPAGCRIPRPPRAALSRPEDTGMRAALASRGRLSLIRRQVRPEGTLEIRAEIDLARAIQPFLVWGVFDSVVLVDDQRRVVMATPRDLNVTRLEPPAVATPAKEETAEGEVARPESFTLSVAEDAYRVFHYGLELGGSSSGSQRLPLTLAGFVPVSRLRTESLAINPLWLAALALVAISGVLLWPFLKTSLMGAAESLRVADLVAMAVSLVLGVGLGVLVSLDTSAYRWPRPGGPHDVDAQLTKLAEKLSCQFEADLEEGLELLDMTRGVPRRVLERHPRARVTEDSPPLAEPERRRLLGSSFTQITWISGDGMQFLKWARDDVPPPMFSVEDREYFRAIRDGRGWGGRRPFPFFVEAVRSRSSGQVLAIFSAPTRVLEQKDDGSTEVVAVGMRPRSVIDPVLPAGFEFAVIDADGRVLFDSQPDRTLEENFFEECQRPRRLRAAVQSRARETLNVRYWGQDHVLAATPLPGTPWSLLVFFRKDQLRAAHFQALTVSATLLLSVVVALALYGALARALAKGGAEVWFWPREGSEARLVLAALLLLLLGGLLAGLAGAPDPALRLRAAALFPLVALGAVVRLLGPEGVRTQRVGTTLYVVPLTALLVASPTKPAVLGTVAAAILLGLAAFYASPRPAVIPAPTLRTAYTGFVLSALLCCSAVPAAVFFRVAWELEMDNYQRSTQLDLAQRVASAHARGDAPPARERLVLSEAMWNTTVVPSDGPSPRAGDCRTSLLEWSLMRTRRFDYPSSRMPAIPNHAGCDGSWTATYDGSERTVTVGPPIVASPLTVRSDAPPFEVYGRWVTWVPLLALGLFVLGLIRLLLRRSFLIDFSDAHTISVSDLAALPLPANLFLLVPSFANLEALEGRRGVDFVSLASRSAADIRQLCLTPSDREVLCLHHFDHVSSDPELAEALLEFLENAPAARASVVIVSEREPESVLRLPAGHEVQARARRYVDRPESRRWERVLGRFVRMVVHDPGDPDRFSLELETVRGNLRARISTDGHVALERLFSTVQAECREHGPLQEVGLAVVRLPGFATLDPYRLVRHIRELADRHYRAVWSGLTDKEKLLLTQVASGNLINPQNRRALNRLLALRLVVKRSRFELVNASFGEFVLAAVTPADVAEWRRSCQTSTWALVRGPVFVTLAAIGVFLGYTQRDFLPAAVGIVGTSVPLLVKLLDLFRGLQGQAKPAS